MFLFPPPPRSPPHLPPNVSPTYVAQPRISACTHPFYFYRRVVHFTRVYLIRDSFFVDAVFASRFVTTVSSGGEE